MDKIKDADYYITNGKIDHKKFSTYQEAEINGRNETGYSAGEEIALLKQTIYELTTAICENDGNKKEFKSICIDPN